MTVDQSKPGNRLRDIAENIADEPTDVFTELVKIAGLNPARDFRFADLSGVSFAGCDLRGYDFTGARLHGCDFTVALLTNYSIGHPKHGTTRPRARLDQAELGIVENMTGEWRKANPHAPGIVSDIANLREAANWQKFCDDWEPPPAPPHDSHLPTGAIFQDAPFAPEMVVLPTGTFQMGSPDGEGDEDEYPQHDVTIGYRLAVGRFPVTFAEWDAAVAAGGISYKPSDEGWGRGRRPVINVSWDDAQAYAKWLSKVTGKTYRLLSEAEWEYARRACTETAYSFGNSITKEQAHYSAKQTVEVGSFPANAFGLHDMHGNVREWCKDVWVDNYEDAPTDGTARTSDGKTVSRVVRGGSLNDDPGNLRSALRRWDIPGYRSYYYGFRLARTLNL